MAWQVCKRVWNSIKTEGDKKKDIDASERLILLALADIADENGICWPKHDTSYQKLGDLVGVNRRSAMRLTESLCEMGHLRKFETVGRGHSNIFVVAIGLSEEEIGARLALIGVTDDTITNEEKVLQEAPIVEPEKEMVLPVTQNDVTGNTNKALNGVTGNTQTIIKTPSSPSLSPNGDSGQKPQEPEGIKVEEQGPEEPEAAISEETLLPDTPEALSLFEKINYNRKLKGRGPMKEFKSREQKKKCLAAMGRLPPTELEKSITKGLEKGLTDIASLINWIARWELPKNGSKNGHTKTTQSNHGTGSARAPVSASGLGEWTEDEKRLYGIT